MPNFTITRQVEQQDIIGCTDFETTETEDEAAILGGGPNVIDGDIIWYIDAIGGFIVDIINFSIPGATLSTVGTSLVFIGGPYLDPTTPPILGVVMDQITTTTIKVTIYLVPSVLHAITGTPFAMPSNNISVALPISGCAEPTPIEV